MASEIRPCTVADIEARPDLLAAYAMESSIPEIGDPDAQFDTYRALERSGVIIPMAAYDGGMIGFIIPLIMPIPHYGVVTATIESFFVAPECRHTGAGMQLLAAAETAARERGAQALLLSAPAGGRLEAVLAARHSYRRTNAVFVRHL
jgi:GNAT superfamily N-acetyltransferase